MNNESDQLDRGVISLLEARFDAALEPLPWESVLERAPDVVRTPTQRRWPLVAASLLLVFGAVFALSTITGDSEPAVTELPPPSLDPVVLEGVGPTRPLSSIVRGDVVVPTRLFSELVLEPVIVSDSWTSQWSAHAGVREESDVVINVSTGMDGEQFGAPDAVITAGGAEWTVVSFDAGQHFAFARFDRFGVFVEVEGIGLGDLQVLLDGLRAGDPQAHAASAYDVGTDGTRLARSADGRHELDVARVGEWLCWSVRTGRASATGSACAVPSPQDDGSMLLGVSEVSSPIDENSTDIDDPRRSIVFSVGFVPSDAVGADIVHDDAPPEFARAGERSNGFDVRFVLGAKSFDNSGELDAEAVDEHVDVQVRAVFDD